MESNKGFFVAHLIFSSQLSLIPRGRAARGDHRLIDGGGLPRWQTNIAKENPIFHGKYYQNHNGEFSMAIC